MRRRKKMLSVISVTLNDHANFIIIVVRYLARLAGNPAPSMAQKLTFSADLRRTPKGP
jgi:hypothetical protein